VKQGAVGGAIDFGVAMRSLTEFGSKLTGQLRDVAGGPIRSSVFTFSLAL
jgi:hypothetical protein